MEDKIFEKEHKHLYFLVVDRKKSDPMTIDDLKEKRISENDLVWRKGLEVWVKARDLEELYEVIEFNPPPIPLESELNQIKSIKSQFKFTKATIAVILTVVIISIIIIFLVSNKNDYKQKQVDQNLEISEVEIEDSVTKDISTSVENVSEENSTINNHPQNKSSVELPKNYFLSSNEKLVFVFDDKNKYWWSKQLLDDPRDVMPILSREQMDYIYNSDYELEIGGWQVQIFDFAVDDLNNKFKKRGVVFKSKSQIDTPLK
jgi:hypothetical protein